MTGDLDSATADRRRRRRVKGAASLAAMGQQIPVVVLPALLISGPVPPLSLGVIEGVAAAAVAGARLVASSRLRRRVGTFHQEEARFTIAALSAALLGAITTTWQGVLLRCGALGLADLDDPSHDRHAASARPVIVGRIAGPLLAVPVLLTLGIRGAMIAGVLPGLLAVGLLPHHKGAGGRGGPPSRRNMRRAAGSLGRRPWLVVAVVAVEVGSVDIALLVLRAVGVFRVDHDLGGAAAAAICLAALHAAAAWAGGGLLGRMGRGRATSPAFAGASLLFVIAYLGIAFTSAASVLVVAFAAAGLALGMCRRAERDLVGEAVPASLVPAAITLLSVAQAAGAAVSSLAVGLLWGLVSLRAAGVYLTVAMLVAVIAIVGGRRAASAGAVLRGDEEQ